MRIFLESVLIAVLATPLGMPWPAIPFALWRVIISKAEASAAADIAAQSGSIGSLFGALLKVGVVGVPGWLVLIAIVAGGAL